MLRIITIFSILSLLLINICNATPSNFSEALKTCEPYEQLGAIRYKGELFNLKITLNKKKNKCIYQEKIFQGTNFHMLTCQLPKDDYEYISNSMKIFTEAYAEEVAKNRIFDAKLTTNADFFNKYAVNPTYCQITNSMK